MKKFLILCVLMFGLTGYSQDVYFQQSNPEAKKEAIEITNLYNDQLGPTGEQELLFQQKVEEFLIRRYKVENEFSGKEKLNILLGLQKEETAEMDDILTRPQLELYKTIKPNIQPLEIIHQE